MVVPESGVRPSAPFGSYEARQENAILLNTDPRLADEVNAQVVQSFQNAGLTPVDFGGAVYTERPDMFFTTGFTPTYGGMSGGGGLTEVLINRGFDIAEAILQRGNEAPAAAPQGGAILGQIQERPLQLPSPSTSMVPQITPPIVGGTGTWPTTKSGKPRRMRKDGRPWKRPSMNPTNPRALGRAMRRVQGFASIAKRTITFTKRVRMKKRKRT